MYSTVALKWSRKIQCGNSCRRISLPLCLVRERCSHTSFLAIYPCLPATTFGQKFSSARNQMLFHRKCSAISNNFFNLLYNISNSRVSYKKLNGWEFGHWLTANFISSAVTRKILSDCFQCPCDAINTFQLKGQSASIIIAFEFFGMFVSTRTRAFLWGEGKVVLVFKIIHLFFDL